MPVDPGVYVVIRVGSDPPDFLDTSTAGRFKGENPTVSRSQLEKAWVPGAATLYIGKASGGKTGLRGLRKRLREYHRHGAGERAGHWGGRYVWQLRDRDDLLVA